MGNMNGRISKLEDKDKSTHRGHPVFIVIFGPDGLMWMAGSPADKFDQAELDRRVKAAGDDSVVVHIPYNGRPDAL